MDHAVMDPDQDSADASDGPVPKTPVKASQLWLGVGLAMAIVTVLSGISSYVFNKTPGMKVREITAETIKLLESGRYRFGRINFPNGDMVGHTGDLQATIEAVEVVEECIGRLMKVMDELGGVLIYTADHGNADIMYTEEDGVRSPKTSHTLSPVPFAIHDPNYAGEYVMDPAPDAGLSHVAATTLNLLGFVAPDDYQPSLLRFGRKG